MHVVRARIHRPDLLYHKGPRAVDLQESGRRFGEDRAGSQTQGNCLSEERRRALLRPALQSTEIRLGLPTWTIIKDN